MKRDSMLLVFGFSLVFVIGLDALAIYMAFTRLKPGAGTTVEVHCRECPESSCAKPKRVPLKGKDLARFLRP